MFVAIDSVVRPRLEFTPSAAVPHAALDCEADVFGHYYGSTLESLEETYGLYRRQTAFLTVTVGDTVIGVCRLIRPGAFALKTFADLGEPPWGIDPAATAAAAGIDLERTWDVATIAVRRRSGAVGRLASVALFHGLVQVSEVNRVDWMTAILDHHARTLMATQGLQVHALPGTGPAPYHGSPACTPVYAHMGRLLEHQRTVNPEGYHALRFGVGLGDLVLPARQDYLLPVRTVTLLRSTAPAGLDAQAQGAVPAHR